jgi:hypothetical protein
MLGLEDGFFFTGTCWTGASLMAAGFGVGASGRAMSG